MGLIVYEDRVEILCDRSGCVRAVVVLADSAGRVPIEDGLASAMCEAQSLGWRAAGRSWCSSHVPLRLRKGTSTLLESYDYVHVLVAFGRGRQGPPGAGAANPLRPAQRGQDGSIGVAGVPSRTGPRSDH